MNGQLAICSYGVGKRPKRATMESHIGPFSAISEAVDMASGSAGGIW